MYVKLVVRVFVIGTVIIDLSVVYVVNVTGHVVVVTVLI